jgi:hypothetical protein
MKRKINKSILFCLLIVFYSFQSCFSYELQNRQYFDGQTKYTFYEKNLEIEEFDRSGKNDNVTHEKVPYRIVYKNNISFLQYGTYFQNEYLIIKNDLLLYLFNENNKQVYSGIRLGTGVGSQQLNMVTGVYDDCVASSFLIESNIKYLPTNIVLASIGNPWVEGVRGNGTNEWIEFSIDQYDPTIIVIANGFISYKKPFLFEQNNRIKLLEISGNGNSEIISLPDSPDFFEIRIDKKFGTRLRLTIKDVYQGSKWEDTCLEMILQYPLFTIKK